MKRIFSDLFQVTSFTKLNLGQIPTTSETGFLNNFNIRTYTYRADRLLIKAAGQDSTNRLAVRCPIGNDNIIATVQPRTHSNSASTWHSLHDKRRAAAKDSLRRRDIGKKSKKNLFRKSYKFLTFFTVSDHLRCESTGEASGNQNCLHRLI